MTFETRYELMRQEDERENRLDAIRERAKHYRVPSLMDYGYQVRCACGFTTRNEPTWQAHLKEGK